MAVRVLLVDDSAVIRGLIARSLTESPEIEIAATAINGATAIIMAKQHQPDVIVLDIEMPEMDGLTALPKILEVSPQSKVIIASTLTLRNADISIQALERGASDYVTKPTARDPQELQTFYRDLKEKVRALAAAKKVRAVLPTPKTPEPVKEKPVPIIKGISTPVTALAIASSTGGPQALLKLFADLGGRLKHIPIFLTQHMPATFTTILAQHLAKAGNRICTEAVDGEEVKPGHAYIAPGNYHMTVAREQNKIVIHLNQNPPVNFCRPAADPMFASLSKVYGATLLAAVLTGMGQDGLEGARTIVNGGGNVIAQDEVTSVVWGMPRAVAINNLCRAVLPLPDIAGYLLQNIGG